MDPDVVRAMWRRWPEANIGLVTGVAFDVLDLDGPDAFEVLKAAAPADAELELNRAVQTGRGVHVYLETTGAGGRTSLIRQRSGIDWRGRDGYVVAPPSIHYSGSAYRWITTAGISGPPAPTPEWLRALVVLPEPSSSPIRSGHRSASCYGRAALEREIGRLALTQEGSRNDTLFRSAKALGQLVGSGDLDATEVVSALLRVAEQWPDLRKSTGTIERGLAIGIRKPRRRPA